MPTRPRSGHTGRQPVGRWTNRAIRGRAHRGQISPIRRARPQRKYSGHSLNCTVTLRAAARGQLPPRRGRRSFRANRPEEVAAFRRDAGRPAGQTARVTPGLQRVDGRGGLPAGTPPEDLVRSLSMGARSALCDKLAAIPDNFAQAEPFRTTELHLEGWLDADKLPPGILVEVKSLVWRRGSGLFFPTTSDRRPDHFARPPTRPAPPTHPQIVRHPHPANSRERPDRRGDPPPLGAWKTCSPPTPPANASAPPATA